MKKTFTHLRIFTLSLLIALLATAAMPSESMAQRTRTEKGKVAVRNGKAGSSSRSSKARTSDRSKTSGSKARSSKARSSKATGSRSATTNSNQDRNRGKATRESARDRSNVRSNDRSNGRTNVQGSGRNGSNRSNASRNSDARSSRSSGSGARGVLTGARSAVRVNGARKPSVVIRKRGNNLRYAPRIAFNTRSTWRYRPYSRINVHISWPWVVRYERHWSPRYRYRQVVYVQARWGSKDRTTRVEMETVYRHKVKYATDDYAVLDIDIEEIALYEGDRYLGTVDRIPAKLSSIEATVYRDGAITFDRDVFIVGDRRKGFELISTEFYNDYAMAKYRDRDGYRAGRLNLRSGKVSSIRRSRLFNPRNFQGYAPISLLPEDEGWLWDYGVDAISAVSDDYDAYYGYADSRRNGYRTSDAMRSSNEYSYSTDFGAEFNVKRESQIQRVE